jgi:hypothetical protein
MNCRDHIAAFDEAFSMARAARPDSVVEVTCAFGGKDLRLLTVGTKLARDLHRPLLKSSAQPTEIELHAELWEPTLKAGLPELNEPADLGEGRGENGERVAVSSDGTAVRFTSKGLVLWLDRRQRRIVGCVDMDRALPWHRYRPLQALLAYWFAGSGVRVVHASAIAREDAGVLLVGRNGVGKSTCATAALHHGMEILGDDVVSVEPTQRRMHTLYTVIKTRTPPEIVDPSVLVTETPQGEPEWITFLNDSAPHRLRPTSSIVAVAFPRLTEARDSQIGSLRRSEAVKQLLVTDQMGTAETFEGLLHQWGRLLDEVPIFRIDVGRDRGSLGTSVAGIIEQAVR